MAFLFASGLFAGGLAVSVGTNMGLVASKNPVHSHIAVNHPHAVAGAAAPLTKPAGYRVVQAGPFNASGGTQSQGEAACPSTKVPVGGGALTSPVGTDDPVLFSSVNSSYPFNNSWIVDVNTSSGSGSGADADFVVYAVCIDKVASYSVISSTPVDNPAGASTLATATCPAKRVLIGGGAFSSSANFAVNLNSDFPSGSATWRAVMENGSASDASMAAYAICEKQPTGYSEQSSIQTVLSGAATPLAVDCPAGSFPLSGGDFTGAVLSLNLSSSFPSSYDWVTFMNDGDSQSWPFETVVVCAS